MSRHSISDNPNNGFHANADLTQILKKIASKPKGKDAKAAPKPDEKELRAKEFSDMHKRVSDLTGADAKTVKHFLDSGHGRGLAAVRGDIQKRGQTEKHVDKHIKGAFSTFKKHYKPDLFEGEHVAAPQYTASSYDKHNDHPSKSKDTFIKGVHGDEAEHVSNIMHSAKNNGGSEISHEQATKIAHHPEYHEHAYAHRHALARGGSNGYDNGVKKLAGTHPHYKDSGSVLKESLADTIKRVINERTAAADKRPVLVRNAKGEMVVRMARRKYDIVDPGGEGESASSGTGIK